eukprot:g4239.t1
MVRIIQEVKLDFKDVLFVPKRSNLRSRKEVSLHKTYKFKHSGQTWTGVPVVVANMDTVGTFEMAIELSKIDAFTCVHKHYTVSQWVEFAKSNPDALKHVAVSTGIGEADMKKTDEILTKVPEITFVCIDVANGYAEYFVDCVRRFRKKYPKHTIMAGNVVTGNMTEQLILSGADVVKVGIGPGSVCTTRKQTGVGYPQLSAVIECSEAAHVLGGLVISDGGCKTSGDVAKAFGANADFVMLGGMFAGHDEAKGDLIVRDGRKFKQFYGMSSATAMKKHAGGVASYRASEGKSVEVPYRGPVAATVGEILGGIRSTCTYIGARTLKDLPKCTTFIRVSQQLNPVFNSLRHFDAPPGLREKKRQRVDKASYPTPGESAPQEVHRGSAHKRDGARAGATGKGH